MQSKVSFSAKIITVVIVFFCSSILLYTDIITKVQENKNATVTEFKENQFKSIWMYLELLQKQADDEAVSVSKNIEKDLLNLSDKDLSQIESDMSNNIHNDTLHNIIMNYSESHNLNNINNSRNGIIIMSTKGFMEDFNYRRASQSNCIEGKFRTWQNSIDSSFNKELEKNAIDKLLNRTSGIIALESYDLANNPDHIKIKELTYKNLLKVYLSEGLEGLRNYQILVPYYITDIGDIFGVPDISQGIIVDNNKIIVVQEFNLYDQIVANSTDIFDNSQIENYVRNSENLIKLLYICGIGLVMAVCGTIFYFFSVYNNIVLSDEIKQLEIDNENEHQINYCELEDEKPDDK